MIISPFHMLGNILIWVICVEFESRWRPIVLHMQIPVGYSQCINWLINFIGQPNLQNDVYWCFSYSSGGNMNQMLKVNEPELMLHALGGFLLYINRKGRILYVSENVNTHLGFHQVWGNNLADWDPGWICSDVVELSRQQSLSSNWAVMIYMVSLKTTYHFSCFLLRGQGWGEVFVYQKSVEHTINLHLVI